MMYNNKMVAVIKTGGRVLREADSTVYLPFGCEYSILLKNLNTVRAEVKITIDDVDVLGGNTIVVNANDRVELERFLKDLSKGNRFKFIERSASVEEHRGVGATDGLIRIEWQFEKPRPIYTARPDPFPQWGGQTPSQWLTASGYNVNGVMRSVDFSNGEATKAYASAAADVTLAQMGYATNSEVHDGMATMDCAFAAPANDVGITVPGSMSGQKFTTVASFPLEEQKYAMVLQLKGETADNKVTAPVTVKAKPKCVTCGKVNKATAKFCSNCGTALEIV